MSLLETHHDTKEHLFISYTYVSLHRGHLFVDNAMADNFAQHRKGSVRCSTQC
jgi:hypothetical protein